MRKRFFKNACYVSYIATDSAADVLLIVLKDRTTVMQYSILLDHLMVVQKWLGKTAQIFSVQGEDIVCLRYS